METIKNIKLPDGNTYKIGGGLDDKITNCITEIPQDIKLELNDGVLTLKAGSKVYVPNGFEADGTTPKFDEVVTTKDFSINTTYNDTRALCIKSNLNGVDALPIDTCCYSGSTAPTNYQWMFWYDTTNNKMKYTSDNGTTWVDGYSLPVCVFSGTNVPTSIDQTFNGFGYIGSSFYFLPNVKALLRNGKNTDGTLKNVERVVDKIYMTHAKGSSSDENFYLAIRPDGCGGWWVPRVYEQVEAPTVFSYGGALWINPLTNESKYHGESNSDTWIDYPVALVGTFTRTATTGAIKNFTPKLPFRAVDYSDSSTVSGWAMPSSKYIDLTLGASGTIYTAPANGWVTIVIDVEPKGNLQINENFYQSSTIAGYIGGGVAVRKGQQIYVGYSQHRSTIFAKFYYAEGEV